MKVSRYLTHIKRLKDPAEPVARFWSRATGLGPRLGPVLLQLPPTLAADAGLLDDVLAEFPPAATVHVPTLPVAFVSNGIDTGTPSLTATYTNATFLQPGGLIQKEVTPFDETLAITFTVAPEAPAGSLALTDAALKSPRGP